MRCREIMKCSYCKFNEKLGMIAALHVMQCRNGYNCHEPQHLRNEKRGSGCLWVISYVCSWQGKLCLLEKINTWRLILDCFRISLWSSENSLGETARFTAGSTGRHGGKWPKWSFQICRPQQGSMRTLWCLMTLHRARMRWIEKWIYYENTIL